MNSSAIRSSSPVVIPGSSCSPTCASVSATTRRRAAISSISWADLRMIIWRSTVPERCWISAKTSSTRPVGVERDELARSCGSARPPARSARGRARAGARSPRACRRPGPPRAARPSSARRARSRRSRSKKRSRRAGGRSRRASRRAPRPGRGCAGSRRGRTRRSASSSREPLADQPDRELVGDEVAARHDRRRPRGRAASASVERAEHVAGRDVRDPVLGRDPLRLGALARPLRAEHQDVHYFRKPS